MDLIFIDSELPRALDSRLLQEVHNAFDMYYEVNCFAVVNGADAFSVLRNEKKRSYVGSFAVLTLEKNVSNFKYEFPNNIIAVKENIDEDEVKRVAKQVVWILTCFGREMLRVKSDFIKRMTIRSK